MKTEITDQAAANISEMTNLQVIEECGRLKFSIAQIVALLRFVK